MGPGADDEVLLGRGLCARLEQVLDNLIENGVKYSPQGGEVRVAVEVIDDSVCLTVADSGVGISPADVPHVFERFWRSRSVDDRRFAGMGLGLYITRRIVEDHGGRIVVQSTPGSGSTFLVSLPRFTGEAEPVGQTEDSWVTPTSW